VVWIELFSCLREMDKAMSGKVCAINGRGLMIHAPASTFCLIPEGGWKILVTL